MVGVNLTGEHYNEISTPITSDECTAPFVDVVRVISV